MPLAPRDWGERGEALPRCMHRQPRIYFKQQLISAAYYEGSKMEVQHGSCYITLINPMLSAAPIHNELTSEKPPPFNSMHLFEGSISEPQERVEELA